MELFYSNDMDGDVIRLPEGESGHCIRVLRHRVGDEVMVSGGDGNLYRCTVKDDDPCCAVLHIEAVEGGFGTHPYHLHMAVAPTKNIDRFEWFLEKAVEIGVDEITPLLCDHSERKIIKPDREERVILSAAKQSLKGTIPVLNPMCTVRELLSRYTAGESGKILPKAGTLCCIAFCDRDLVNSAGESAARVHLADALQSVARQRGETIPHILILIGPEGDFSREELLAAADCGMVPVSLGGSRLRTETAGVVAVTAVGLTIR